MLLHLDPIGIELRQGVSKIGVQKAGAPFVPPDWSEKYKPILGPYKQSLGIRTLCRMPIGSLFGCRCSKILRKEGLRCSPWSASTLATKVSERSF